MGILEGVKKQTSRAPYNGPKAVLKNFMFLYLEEQENLQVDNGDDNDRDQELEESREYCVP